MIRAVALAVGIVLALATPAAANPYLGPPGTATMHGDAESSDTTTLPGPGLDPTAEFVFLGAACPTILQGSDGIPQALCTNIVDRVPTVHLLDPKTGRSTASLPLVAGTLLGGVYAYLDNADRMVTVDGSGHLLRIGHDDGRLFVADRVALAPGVTSVLPDFTGAIWYATDDVSVGFYDPETEVHQSITLGAGERVANSISTAPDGVAVATDHALYLLTRGVDDPKVLWRQPYDRGPGRKPGQLSWGTGATPTFFGPASGTEYVTITDNAVPQENLLVYETVSGRQVCALPVIDGTENSPVGVGTTVYVASTYGYPYPALPPGAGPSVPPAAPITGGMTRIEVTDSGCAVKWRNDVRSASVPRLSLADGNLYTVTRRDETYHYAVLDPDTGALRAERPIGVSLPFDTLQMVGTIAPGGVLYQGTTTGLFRIS